MRIFHSTLDLLIFDSLVIKKFFYGVVFMTFCWRFEIVPFWRCLTSFMNQHFRLTILTSAVLKFSFLLHYDCCFIGLLQSFLQGRKKNCCKAFSLTRDGWCQCSCSIMHVRLFPPPPASSEVWKMYSGCCYSTSL